MLLRKGLIIIGIAIIGVLTMNSCAKTTPTIKTEKTEVIAHRGGITKYHENTIHSFKHAIELGADFIEFDIRKTKDNIIIIHHDAGINGRLISNLTYSEIQSIATNYKVPTFEDLLKTAQSKIKLDIELKEAGYEKEVIDITLKYFTTDDIIVTSFMDSAILTVKNDYPNIKTGLLLGVKDGGLFVRLSEIFFYRRFRKSKADFIAPNYQFVDYGILRKASRRDVSVALWTVNKSDLILQYLNHPKVIAIITDDPKKVLELREASPILPK